MKAAVTALGKEEGHPKNGNAIITKSPLLMESRVRVGGETFPLPNVKTFLFEICYQQTSSDLEKVSVHLIFC